jgi:hypothetical protein
MSILVTDTGEREQRPKGKEKTMSEKIEETETGAKNSVVTKRVPLEDPDGDGGCSEAGAVIEYDTEFPDAARLAVWVEGGGANAGVSAPLTPERATELANALTKYAEFARKALDAEDGDKASA